MNKPTISVIFPVYNEGYIIEKMITSYYNELKGKIDFEMIVVEDGSTDGTKEILQKLQRELPIRVYMSDQRKGFQEAVIHALQFPKYDWIFLVDSDYQFEPQDFWKLLPYINQYDVILGIKIKRKDPFHRIFLSRGFNFLLRFFFHVPFKDMDTGFRLIHRRAIEAIVKDIHCFQYFTAEFIVRSFYKNFQIKQVGVTHLKREKGNTNVFPIRKIPRIVVQELIGMYKLYRELRPQVKAYKASKMTQTP